MAYLKTEQALHIRKPSHALPLPSYARTPTTQINNIMHFSIEGSPFLYVCVFEFEQTCVSMLWISWCAKWFGNDSD